MNLALISASVLASVMYGAIFTLRPTSWLKTAIKTTPVASLAILAWIGDVPTLLFIALFAGAIGDTALSRDGPRGFLIGLSAFLVGHLCYVILFSRSVLDADTQAGLRLGTVLFVLLVFAAGVWVYRHIRNQLDTLLLPVAIYILTSIILAIVAFASAGQYRYPVAVTGALLFILSDILLAFDLFGDIKSERRRILTARWLWFLYWSGQCLILIGMSAVVQ